MSQKQAKKQRDNDSPSFYGRVATGLASQPAYLLVFAICALFFLSGTVTTAKAVMSNDFRFGILAFVSFIIAIAAAIIIVREVERKSVPAPRVSTANSDHDANLSLKPQRIPVDTPRVGKRPEPLDPKTERTLLVELSEWAVLETEDPFAEGRLRRELHRMYEFTTFDAAFHFMKEVTDRAITPYQHHPRWQNAYNRVEVWLTTFNLGCRLSARDRRLAKLFEQIWEELCRDELSKRREDSSK
jgi:4a-hydroxytetrahydrobiopterin dehydratase